MVPELFSTTAQACSLLTEENRTGGRGFRQGLAERKPQQPKCTWYSQGQDCLGREAASSVLRGGLSRLQVTKPSHTGTADAVL